jgi:hypothetical protein
MKGKIMISAGELLARKLRGDTSVSDGDIKDATEGFFKNNGVNVECTINAPVEKEAEEQ